MWNHLQETDGCALIWLYSPNTIGEGHVYVGESGKRWNQEGIEMHWIAVIDSTVEDGQEKIAIADPGSGEVEWFNLEEFKYGISDMVLINPTVEDIPDLN